MTLALPAMVTSFLPTVVAALRRAMRSPSARLLVLASVTGMTIAAERPITHTVVMKATSYAPLALTIKLGDTVLWRNEDPFPHTATAGGVFDSKSIAAGGSWKYRPRAAGEYGYICTFHPNMKGMLKVE